MHPVPPRTTYALTTYALFTVVICEHVRLVVWPRLAVAHIGWVAESPSLRSAKP